MEGPMKKIHFIRIEVHCLFCEIAVLSPAGKVVRRYRCETTIPAMVDALAKVAHPCSVVIEEGPMASWLRRNLHAEVAALVVSEPRQGSVVEISGHRFGTRT
jgi:hypothetical protein